MFAVVSRSFVSAVVGVYSIAFSDLCFSFGAMAEAPKTEYVSARFRTLQGQERTLTFPRTATLGLFCCTHRDDKNTERQRDGEANFR